MNPLNLYSALLVFILGLLLAGGYILRRGLSRERALTLISVALGFTVAWFFVRPVQTPHEKLADIQSQIGAGTPVLLEFQSPYWLACLAAKPIVDGLERDYAGHLLILRIDVQDVVGKALAREQSVIATPTFIFFTAQGERLWRSVGTINIDQVAESLR